VTSRCWTFTPSGQARDSLNVANMNIRCQSSGGSCGENSMGLGSVSCVGVNIADAQRGGGEATRAIAMVAKKGNSHGPNVEVQAVTTDASRRWGIEPCRVGRVSSKTCILGRGRCGHRGTNCPLDILGPTVKILCDAQWLHRAPSSQKSYRQQSNVLGKSAQSLRQAANPLACLHNIPSRRPSISQSSNAEVLIRDSASKDRERITHLKGNG
jgi:hypothetical protein